MRSPASPVQAWIRPDWPLPPGVRAISTVRRGLGVSPAPFDDFNLGNMTGTDGDAPANVRHNRTLLQAHASLPAAPCWLRQVHGSTVALLEAPPPVTDPPREADAAVTHGAGVVLAILSADCLPVLLASDDGRVLGAAHAGWRGLAAGVLEATVAAMAVAPGRLSAWLGPAAGPQAYEVGEEVREAFTAHAAEADAAFTATRPGHWRVDLFALARQRLAVVGVARVHGGGACTISDPTRYFSHRRDGRSGRMATLVWREA
jgi:YfiH family protein